MNVFITFFNVLNVFFLLFSNVFFYISGCIFPQLSNKNYVILTKTADARSTALIFHPSTDHDGTT